MSTFGFDTANTAAARPSFEPMKPGWYAMRITQADIVGGKSANVGQMLKITFECIDQREPAYVNRKVFANLCHQHENKQTREIAQGQIVTILDSIGKHGATSVDAMLGGELQVKLAVRPADGTYDARNEVKGFRALDAADGAPAPASGTKPASAPSPQAARPWAKR